LCVQLTRDLFAIAKFLLFSGKFVLYKPSLDEPTAVGMTRPTGLLA